MPLEPTKQEIDARIKELAAEGWDCQAVRVSATRRIMLMCQRTGDDGKRETKEEAL